MSNTPFLSKATALVFLIAAVAIFAFRERYPTWVPLFAACVGGAVAATMVGRVAHRRSAKSADAPPAGTRT